MKSKSNLIANIWPVVVFTWLGGRCTLCRTVGTPSEVACKLVNMRNNYKQLDDCQNEEKQGRVYDIDLSKWYVPLDIGRWEGGRAHSTLDTPDPLPPVVGDVDGVPGDDDDGGGGPDDVDGGEGEGGAD